MKPSAKRIAESNLRSYQAAVTLRAVRTDNAVNLATASEDASVVALEDVGGSAKALKTAGGKALEKLVPQMIAKWQKSTEVESKAAEIKCDLAVGGVDQVWKLKALREKLRSMQEITALNQKSYAQGLALFQATARLPAEELAEALVLDPPEELRVQIVEIKPGSITLRVVEDK